MLGPDPGQQAMQRQQQDDFRRFSMGQHSRTGGGCGGCLVLLVLLAASLVVLRAMNPALFHQVATEGRYLVGRIQAAVHG